MTSDSSMRPHRLARGERAAQTADLVAGLADVSNPRAAAQLRERLVLVNLQVAEAVAGRYENRGVPDDDLRQVAYEGLVKAVARFDPAQGHDFLTYAVPTIRGELQRHFRDRSWAIRVPRKVSETQWRVNQMLDELEHALGREPTADELADAAGVSIEDYREAMAASGCFQPTSLDLTTGSGDGSESARLADVLPDDADPGYGSADAKVMLLPVLRRLPERDLRILRLRFADDLTQAEIGEDIGVTQMQVSRLLTRILRTLRRELERSA